MLESKSKSLTMNSIAENSPVEKLKESSSSSSLASLSSIISTDNLSAVAIKKTSLMINYSLCYKHSNSTLMINLISLENVKSASKLTDLNIYVKIEVILLNKSGEQKQLAKTRMIRNRTNPVYDELFEFKSTHEDLINVKLLFNICNSNLFGRDQLIGFKEHSIEKKELINMEYKEPFLFRMYSQSADSIDAKDNFNLGHLQICLLYKKLSKTLSVHLIKANNLQIPLNYSNNDKIPSKFQNL